MPLPPDRSHLSTEQRHPGSADLDALSIDAGIALFIDDHQRVRDAVDAARPALAALIESLVLHMRDGGRLIYLGAGTSGRLGVLDASECPPTFQSDPSQVIGIIAGGDSALRTSSEGAEDDPNGAAAALDALNLTARDTVVGIAAGGTTPYVVGGLRHARERNATTALLTCAPGDYAHAADHVIVLDTGPELLTGSTRLKAGSATKLALNIITTLTFVGLGKTCGDLMVDLRATNDKLRDRAIRILREFSPDLGRDQAAEVLDRAGGMLKRAIVMQRAGLDADAAQQLLDGCDGRLRPAFEAIDQPASSPSPSSSSASGASSPSASRPD